MLGTPATNQPSRPEEAEALLTQLDKWMAHRPTYALVMLQMPCFRDDRGVVDALYKPAGPPTAPAEVRRVRRLRALVATILEGIRRKLNIPTEQFAAESQVETMPAAAAADSQNVLFLDPTQSTQHQPPLPTTTGAATDDGDGEGERDFLDGFQLYGLLHPCRGAATATTAAGDETDPATAVTNAMEANRRATVSLDALAKSLLRSSYGSATGAAAASAANDVNNAEAETDSPPTVDEAEAAAQTATRMRTEAEAALSQLAAEALRGVDDSRKRIRDAAAAAAADAQEHQHHPPQPTAAAPAPVSAAAAAADAALPAGARSMTAVVDDFDAVTGVPGLAAPEQPVQQQQQQQQQQQRHRTPYTAAEDRAILEGVARFSGISRFTKILAQNRDGGVFHSSRTATGLYDRYRHVLRRQRLLAAAAGDTEVAPSSGTAAGANP